MFGGGGDSGYKKLSTVNRRMFIMTAAKLVIFGGIITRPVSYTHLTLPTTPYV